VAELETDPKPSLYGVARFAIVFGTLGVLAWIAFAFVSVEFRLGTRYGIRSAAGIALPMIAGGYAFAAHRGFLRRLRDLPAAVRFSASLVAGALVMASIRFFLVLYPLVIPELVIASCIALLVFASDSIPGLALDVPPRWSDRPLAPFYGLAAGMLLYLVVYGVPRIPG
jgi:hypothetical protein